MEQSAENLFSISRRTVYLAIAIAIATYYKIWLSDVYILQAVFAPHDDHHFVTLASHILNGDWLGRYDQYTQYTLMKGVFYPIWIAACNIVGVPLLTAQHLLYAFACVIFIIAVSIEVKHRGWLFVIYLFLLFNPFTIVVARVFRFGIYPALTLLVIASAYGLYTRTLSGKGKPYLWSLSLGLSLSAFWHTREEAIWIIPSLIVIFFFTLYGVWVKKGFNLKKIAVLYTLPFILLGFSTLTLATLNWQNYGVFTPLEIHSSEFESAYSGLLRIRANSWKRFYPVVREARRKAYAVSPTFSELRPYLEGEVGNKWKGNRDDIPAAFFIWTFRDAVQRAGYYNFSRSKNPKTIKQTFEFYERMGNELKQACDSGRLECAKLLSPFVPIWHKEFSRLLMPTFYDNLKRLVSFDKLDYKKFRQYSVGGHKTFQLYETVTNEKIEADTERVRLVRPEFYKEKAKKKKKTIRNLWNNFYRQLVPWFFIAFLILIPVRGVYELIRRKVQPATVLGLAVLAAILSNTMIVTLVQITSYSEISRAMMPGYPVVIIFIVAGFMQLTGLLRSWRRKEDTS
jgi:hypothetical protein